jgi:hypothetical protein
MARHVLKGIMLQGALIPMRADFPCLDKRSGPPGASANMCEESSGQVCWTLIRDRRLPKQVK